MPRPCRSYEGSHETYNGRIKCACETGYYNKKHLVKECDWVKPWRENVELLTRINTGEGLLDLLERTTWGKDRA